MLAITDLVKQYRRVRAVDGVTMNIERGQVVALLGPNGSGKTTLMKMVTGLIKPTGGTITLDGEPIGPKTKARVAYMPTEAYFYHYMTIADVAAFYRDFFRDFDHARFHKLLDQMNLHSRDKVLKLSSGMTAKLKIAATLARASEVVMLDEPLNGVDIIARDQVVQAIRDSISPERSFLLSSHLVDELEKLVDHAVFLKDGRVAKMGDVEALRSESGQSLVDQYKEIYREGEA